MTKAYIQLEFQDGTKFRWVIPEKYAWKLFLERWASKKEEVKPKQEEDDDEYKLDWVD